VPCLWMGRGGRKEERSRGGRGKSRRSGSGPARPSLTDLFLSKNARTLASQPCPRPCAPASPPGRPNAPPAAALCVCTPREVRGEGEREGEALAHRTCTGRACSVCLFFVASTRPTPVRRRTPGVQARTRHGWTPALPDPGGSAGRALGRAPVSWPCAAPPIEGQGPSAGVAHFSCLALRPTLTHPAALPPTLPSQASPSTPRPWR
jgi:hypothetical protein